MKKLKILYIIVILIMLISIMLIASKTNYLKSVFKIGIKQENEEIAPLFSYVVYDNKDTQNTFTTTKTELKGALLKDNVDVLCNLKNLYVLGTDINWDILYPNGVGNIMNLPAYPFVKNSVWLD